MNLLAFSIVVSFSNMFLMKFIPKLVSWILDNSKENRIIKDDILSLKKEQSEISMVREFSKHAKLQRRINKLNEDLKTNIRKNASKNIKIKSVCKLSLYIVFAIFNIIFVYWNSNQTVLNELPTNWFSPLSWLISWPLWQFGSMSFLFWYALKKSGRNGIGVILNEVKEKKGR